ncbi:MAG: hypothetical protein GXC94_02190 [Comamonadaceae bacterium]|nr:hypothetical protein [Comamonadaceae bacterium]
MNRFIRSARTLSDAKVGDRITCTARVNRGKEPLEVILVTARDIVVLNSYGSAVVLPPMGRASFFLVEEAPAEVHRYSNLFPDGSHGHAREEIPVNKPQSNGTGTRVYRVGVIKTTFVGTTPVAVELLPA